MANEQNKVHEELSALKKDFASLRGDVSKLVTALVESGKESGHDAAERVQEGFHNAKQRGQQSVNDMGHRIEDNPWASVGIAFGVGVAFGFLMRK